MGLPKPVEVDVIALCSPGARHEAIGVNICPAGFWSCFDPLCIIFLLLSFGRGLFFLCKYILERLNLFFWFLQGLVTEFALSLRGDLKIGGVSNGRIIKTLGILGDGLNAFCIM